MIQTKVLQLSGISSWIVYKKIKIEGAICILEKNHLPK